MTELEPRPVPGKVQAIGILHLVGGLMNVFSALVWAVYGLITGVMTFGIGLLLCVPTFILLPIGIVELVSAARHLKKDHSGLSAPKLTGITEIASILGCNVISTVFGILTLVFLSDPEVEQHYNDNQIPTY